jgi:hypothetical protein
MRIFLTLGAAGLSLVAATTALLAGSHPVETHTADAYIDPQGCVYLRARGGSGWVADHTADQQRSCPATLSQDPTVTTQRVRIGPASAPDKIAEARSISPPPGFSAAWDDGRLNPYKGVGKRKGKASMELIWTNTVPRRLIVQP